jgi:ketosteroid isomerase-like protein
MQLNVYVPREKEGIVAAVDETARRLGRQKNEIVLGALETYVAAARPPVGIFHLGAVKDVARDDLYLEKWDWRAPPYHHGTVGRQRRPALPQASEGPRASSRIFRRRPSETDVTARPPKRLPRAFSVGAPPKRPRARPGPEGVKPLVAQIHRLFKNYRSEIEDLIAEGDKVVARLRVRGVHNGTMFDIPPTGKEAVWTETHVARFRDGKMVEHWFDYDGLGLKEQLRRAAAAEVSPRERVLAAEISARAPAAHPTDAHRTGG